MNWREESILSPSVRCDVTKAVVAAADGAAGAGAGAAAGIIVVSSLVDWEDFFLMVVVHDLSAGRQADSGQQAAGGPPHDCTLFVQEVSLPPS